MLHIGYSVLSFFVKGEDADMATGGNLLQAKSGITPKANTDMALWGFMSPEVCAVFRRPLPSSPKRVAKRKSVLKDGYDIRTVQELAWPQRCEDNPDLHPCAESRWKRGEKPDGRGVNRVDDYLAC